MNICFTVRLSDQVLAPAASRSFRGSQEGPGPGGRETSYYRDPKSVRGKSRDAASVGGAILPEFEDENRTVVVGKPGGKVHLDCNIFMLQDFTVSSSTLHLIRVVNIRLVPEKKRSS